MTSLLRRMVAAMATAVVLTLPLTGAARAADAPGNPERGAYILRLGGCVACHTDTKNKHGFLAGGVALNSPYGTFYTPNITPDKETGIGSWSTEDFIRAMTEGKPPSGLPFYPAFPYTSYTHMARQDLIDLKAYLDTVAPVKYTAPGHQLHFPYNIRFGIVLWRLLFFKPGPFVPHPDKSATWNRGAYIVTGPAHCGECHTPRNFFGAMDESQPLAGTSSGPEGKPIPGITQHPKHGIGGWSQGDIEELLKSGFMPDGDVVGGAMAEVVEDSSSHWTDDDRAAVAEYLLSLPSR